ncbi:MULTISPECIES: HTTM domain-containing protein [unclassified Streptomyces]|uniref:HTTM domain-containing protein n=1 Tax=unclassified Streptomyces TaxID=2593676 RepID=UPI002252191B|nr:MULTISPECIES: HTTM domain-containing protein [unclassified Streptomyces]WSP56195.1 HTTM domain-containing protein [Streptomyces sp. NBC_01241]WSU23106.1 HTTM domain-containing protein [Streptomyces sp. NBC_01108]MCX4787905.1 HTTM domain-containing protein [Streptomyces sp. NBC_01221]MCX4796332.1 HTTM domain-containing protein [Streptomyces sp. NBC_01242]WSJ37574.1 HTTM domain-containing protein [Streptomyces sp. NBC_01321]
MITSTFDRKLARGIQRITSSALGPYQSAVIRIGFSTTYLLFLLRELPHRHEMYGPDAPWRWDMAQQLISGNRAFTTLMWSDSTVWFEAVYAVALLSAVLLMVGWHTRATSVLFMVGVLSLQNRSIFLGDGGDNVIHLMAIYLVLTRCGQVWSLDARRAARAGRAGRVGRAPGPPAGADVDADVEGHRRSVRGDVAGPVLWVVLGLVLTVTTVTDGLGGTSWLPVLFWLLWVGHGAWWVVNRRAPESEARTLLDVIANLAHNATLVVIAAEVCVIYATAGWYKIQGSRWQDGTALYYPLKLDYFTPWPGLSDILASSGVMVMLLTYGTVIVQVAFPFTLFNRRVKNVLLVAMMCEHAGIALLLGLPFFSMAMIAADSVFLPTVFLVWFGGRVTLGRELLFSRMGKVPGQRRAADDEEAPQHSDDGGHTLVG